MCLKELLRDDTMSKGGFTGVEIKGGEHVLCIILAYVKGDKCPVVSSSLGSTEDGKKAA